MTSSTTTNVTSANGFYKILFDAISNRTAIADTPYTSLTTQSNTASKYNCSGNLKITATIPQSESQTVNYAKCLLGTSETSIGDWISYITSLISSEEFIVTPPIDNLSATAGYTNSKNGVTFAGNPIVDLKAILDDAIANDQWRAWNLNYGRSYTSSTVQTVVAHILNSLNAIIEYVLTNDITTPDDTFKDLVTNMFMDSASKVYQFGHNTLLLPAIVNYVAAKAGQTTTHASRYTGYIQKDSGIFVQVSTTFEDETKWLLSNQSIAPAVTAPYSCVIDGTQQLVCGRYNYPCGASVKNTDNWTPSTTLVTSTDTSVLTDISIGFTSDNYKYVDPRAVKTFATTTGERTEPTGTYSGRKLESSEYSSGTSLRPTATPGVSDSVYIYRKWCSKWALWCWSYSSCSITHTLSENATNYEDTSYHTYKTGIYDNSGTSTCSSTKTTTASQLGNDGTVSYTKANSSFKGNYDTGNYCRLNVDCGDYTSKNYQDSVDITDKALISTVPTYRYASGKSSVTMSTSDASNKFRHGGSGGYAIKSDVYVQTKSYPYTGEFKSGSVLAGPKSTERQVSHDANPENVVKRFDLICLYHTTADCHYFNDSVFKDWVNILQQSWALEVLLSEIRSRIINNPGIILLNRVNRVMGPLARSLTRTTTYVDLPFGPPMIRVPSCYVLPNKYYHSGYSVDNTIDGSYTTYTSTNSSVDIINKITTASADDSWKASSYLDEAWTLMNNSVKITGEISDDTCFMALLPRRGFQLFDAVNDIASTDNTYDIKTEDLVSVTTSATIIAEGSVTKPRIVACKSALSSTLTSYTNILSDTLGSISVPIISIKYIDDGTIDITINTLDNDESNKMYIYVSKASDANGSYSFGVSQSTDSRGIIRYIANVAYDGAETADTPTMLMNKYY